MFARDEKMWIKKPFLEGTKIVYNNIDNGGIQILLFVVYFHLLINYMTI